MDGELVHFQVCIGDRDFRTKACGPSFIVLDPKTLTVDRSGVTCGSCRRTLAFKAEESQRLQVTVTLGPATEKTRHWLMDQLNRSLAIVEVLNKYVETLP